MLRQDIIKPFTSPYSAPIWFVPKKDDALMEKNGELSWTTRN